MQAARSLRAVRLKVKVRISAHPFVRWLSYSAESQDKRAALRLSTARHSFPMGPQLTPTARSCTTFSFPPSQLILRPRHESL